MHIFYLIIYCSVLHRFFGGMRDDIKRKMPWYWSDFKDALHVQCIASFFFMYFACLTSVVTFGGLLGIATDNNMVCMYITLGTATSVNQAIDWYIHWSLNSFIISSTIHLSICLSNHVKRNVLYIHILQPSKTYD